MDGPLLLDGAVVDERDTEIAALKRETEHLRRQVRRAEQDADDAKRDAHRALSELRKQLSPLYRALQMVFGELDAAGIADTADETSRSAPSAAGAKNAAVWEAWKAKLPPACGKVIDALLVHSDLNQAQIKVAARLGTSTVSDAVWKLNKAGLIDKNGGRVSLKQL